MRWVSVDDRMPDAGVPVIAFVAPNEFGKTRRIRAQYAPPNTLEQAPECGGGYYDEDTDKYYCEEGWYETNEYEEIHWAVGGVVTYWMPLPNQPGTEQTSEILLTALKQIAKRTNGGNTREAMVTRKIARDAVARYEEGQSETITRIDCGAFDRGLPAAR